MVKVVVFIGDENIGVDMIGEVRVSTDVALWRALGYQLKEGNTVEGKWGDNTWMDGCVKSVPCMSRIVVVPWLINT